MTRLEDKKRLRKQVNERIDTLSDRDQARLSIDLCHRLNQAMKNIDGMIFAFLSIPGEVNLKLFLEQRIAFGLAVPIVDWRDHSMYPARLHGLEPSQLTFDARGLAIPVQKELVTFDEIQAVVVPGVAFDESGRRLGRGGGFYDRFLESMPAHIQTFGVAFDEQITETIPVDPWDQTVKNIVTPSRTIQIFEK